MRDRKTENEANLFAMFLLMPTKFIAEDLKDGISMVDDKKIIELAKKYEVPLTAMAVRIAYYLKHKT